MDRKPNHPGPKPPLWDIRFLMLLSTFGLLWAYLVAQGATAFQIVSNHYWLGFAAALAIEIGEVAALILWASEAESKAWSWQFGAVVIAAILSGIVQYLAADSVAGDKIRIELKIALSVGISTLAVFLGKSAGERFSTWQMEFIQWKAAEMEWEQAEEREVERLEYEREQEEKQQEWERKQVEDTRKYRRKRKEERERLKAEPGGRRKKEIIQESETRLETAEELSDTYTGHLKSLLEYLSSNGISITASDASYILGIGKSQTYKVLSAGVSTKVLEKSGRKWRKVDGVEEEISEVLSDDQP